MLLTLTVLPCPRLWPEGQIREERCEPGVSTDGGVTKGSGVKGQIQSVWPDGNNSLLTAFPASVSLQCSSRPCHSPAHKPSMAPHRSHYVKFKAFTTWPHCL